MQESEAEQGYFEGFLSFLLVSSMQIKNYLNHKYLQKLTFFMCSFFFKMLETLEDTETYLVTRLQKKLCKRMLIVVECPICIKI